MHDHAAEIKALQRCLRDLVALSALPAVWIGQEAPRVADSLAEVVLRTIALDVIGLALRDPVAGARIQVVRASRHPGGADAELLRQAVVPWLDGNSGEPPASIPDPCRPGSLRLARLPIGWDAEAGVLLVGSRRPDFPSQTDRLLLSVAANQASVAIDNARLYRQARAAESLQEQQAREARLVADVGVALTETAELPMMLRRVCEALVHHLAVAFARIWTLDEAENALELGASAGIYTHLDGPHRRVPVGTLKIGRIAQERRPHLTNQVVSDPRVSDQEWAKREGMVAFAGYPLEVEGRLLGVMAMFARHPLAEGTLAVLASVADLVAQGIERKRLEEALAERAEELEATNRRKDEFLAMLGHELRNPLGAVSNALAVLRELGPQERQVLERQAIIERQTKHLTKLVDDLLDVSRITRGLIELDREPVDLASVVAHAVEACRALVDDRHHDLSVLVPLDPVWVEADATRLEQIICNLLTNAARYTEPGGRITLTAEHEGSAAVIRVRDNGAGILPEMLPRIFDLFAQAHRALDWSRGGLGIGLTLVRNLVELHGGTVAAHSPGPGLGSEFVVRLPALPTIRAQAPLPQTAVPEPLRSLRILVVDDNADAAVTLADLLQLRGHQVQVVHTGPAAVDAALAERPEVVLLDIGLPGMSGYEVARQLRDREGQQSPPMLLVAVTGYGQKDDQQHAREAGFDHHLVKPMDFNALQQILAALVSGRILREVRPA